MRTRRIALQDVIRGAVEIGRPVVDQNRQELTVNLSAEPVYLHADLARLTQVVMNPLINAAKYTEPGGHIELIAALEGADAVIRVKDDGIGIDATVLPRLFDMFFSGRPDPGALTRRTGHRIVARKISGEAAWRHRDGA